MERIERLLNEEIRRIEEELMSTGKAALITFSSENLKPLAINIVRRNESFWSESGPGAFIREGVEVIKGDFYITIIGEADGKQFAISKKIEL